jgi:hypothetical protein
VPRSGTSSEMILPSRTSSFSAVEIFMGSGRMSAGPASDIFFSNWRVEAKRRTRRILTTLHLARSIQPRSSIAG